MSEGSKTITMTVSRGGAEEFLKQLEDMPYRILTQNSQLMEIRLKLRKLLEDPTWT